MDEVPARSIEAMLYPQLALPAQAEIQRGIRVRIQTGQNRGQAGPGTAQAARFIGGVIIGSQFAGRINGYRLRPALDRLRLDAIASETAKDPGRFVSPDAAQIDHVGHLFPTGLAFAGWHHGRGLCKLVHWQHRLKRRKRRRNHELPNAPEP